MPIQWRPFVPRITGPQFLRVPPSRIVWFMSSPNQHAIIDLHWLPSGKGSFPCLGEECRLHDLPIETHAYTIVLWTPSYEHPNWTPAILDLGKPDKELVQLDLRGKARVVKRSTNNDKQTPIVLGGELELPKERLPAIVQHRDVKPYLMSRWNMQEVEEYFAPRQDNTQKRLFTGEE